MMHYSELYPRKANKTLALPTEDYAFEAQLHRIITHEFPFNPHFYRDKSFYSLDTSDNKTNYSEDMPSMAMDAASEAPILPSTPITEKRVHTPPTGTTKNSLAPEYDTPTETEEPVRHEVSLWRAVILQALSDAMTRSPKVEMQYEKQQARVWLEGRHQDFFTVCEHAALDPHYVRERAKSALLLADTLEKSASHFAYTHTPSV